MPKRITALSTTRRLDPQVRTASINERCDCDRMDCRIKSGNDAEYVRTLRRLSASSSLFYASHPRGLPTV
jgi:hypothetical protein